MLLASALLTDWLRQRLPSRRKRRCPKCWYDLSHTPGLRCSECGREVKRERTLFRAKRRWGLAALGLVLLLGSHAWRVTPEVRDRGWVAAVPTTVMIAGLPWLEIPDLTIAPAPPPGSEESWQSLIRKALFEELTDKRMVHQTMPAWQRRWLFRRAVATTEYAGPTHVHYYNHRFQTRQPSAAVIHQSLTRCRRSDAKCFLEPEVLDRLLAPARERFAHELVEMRADGVRGLPLEIILHKAAIYIFPTHRLLVATPVFPGAAPAERKTLDASDRNAALGPKRDVRFTIGVPPDDATEIEFLIEVMHDEKTARYDGQGLRSSYRDREVIWSTRIRKPLQLFDSVEEIIAPVSSPLINELLRDRTKVRIGSGDQTKLVAAMVVDWNLLRREEMMFAGDVLVLYHDEVVARGDFILHPFLGPRTSWRFAPIIVRPKLQPPPDHVILGTVSARLSGDLARLRQADPNDPAWRVVIRSDLTRALESYDARRAWQGEVTAPLRVSLEEPEKEK